MVRGSPAGGDAGRPAPGEFAMIGQQPPVIPDQNVRTMQIIIGALTAGVLTFAGVAVALRASGPAPAGRDMAVVSYIAVGFGAVILVVHAVMMAVQGGAIRRRLADQGLTPAGLAGLYTARLIVGAALLEGAALFLLMAYLLDSQWWTLAVGLVFAGLIPALHFPTRERVDRWVEAQRERAMAG